MWFGLVGIEGRGKHSYILYLLCRGAVLELEHHDVDDTHLASLLTL